MNGRLAGRSSIFASRAALAPLAVLTGLAVVSWLLTIRQATGMGSMVSGLGQVGAPMPNEIGPSLFMLMWLTMMGAMMLSGVAPMVLAHRMVVRSRGEGWSPTAAFVAGYLAVWTAIGVVPLLAFLGFQSLSAPAPAWVAPMAGGTLIAAGLYQFTPWKGACLKTCRSPLNFILTHDFGRGAPGAALAGASHGAWCVGCCWALMTVLVAVGLMNLVWMAALSVVFVLEKNWRFGVELTRVAGSVVIVLGVAVIAVPGILSLLSNFHS
ncbi:MAG TPA: DUF2182 domain-containing protein [Candidatus Dormibacteraeota bacterium]|nr:DUF2182 domain-containing protein [Candidatus Dormibacteraeota bacterium]